MRVFLDLCSIQRPLDSRNQVRIAVEAEAVLGILALSDRGQVQLISSASLVFEADQNPNPLRKQYTFEVLADATSTVSPSEAIEVRARQLMDHGLGPFDALHLASAEAGSADFFCTCDDRLLKKARSLAASPTRAVSPLELIAEVVP